MSATPDAPAAAAPATTGDGRPGRLRRWLPGLALAGGAGLGLLGLGALGLSSQGLTITVSPPKEPSTEADPLALLRADQSALAEDVQQVDGHLGDLARALEEVRAGDEAARARADAARAAAEAERAARLERRLAALEARLHGLTAVRADGAAGVAAPGSATAAPEPVAEAPSVAAPDSAAAPQPTTEAPAARGVFSFKAGRGPDLDERQRYEVIAALSRVGFDAKSTMHDFTGVTSDVDGWVEVRLSDPGRDGRALIQARAATLRTGVDGRDEEMRSRLETDRHPQLRFDLTGFELERLDRATSKLRGHALGTFTIHGVTRPVRVAVDVEVDPQRRLVVTGEARLKMSDHGVTPPNLGVITVEDEVKVWLSLRLRSLGKASRT